MTSTDLSLRMTDSEPAAPRSRRRRRVVLGLLVLLVVVTAGLPGVRRAVINPAGRAPLVGVTQVEIRDDLLEGAAFTPSVIEVPAGSTVTWTFLSGEQHNVVFDDLASPTQDWGTWSNTFTQPGSYPYVCTLHAGMEGRVDVTS